MKLLVLNCGGSSLKYQLLDMPAEKVLARGQVDRLGTPQASWRHLWLRTEGTVADRGDGQTWQETLEAPTPIQDFASGIQRVVARLVADRVLREAGELAAITHKLAHGGERFQGAVLVDETVLATLREISVLAPVHNPPAVRGIEMCREVFPAIPQVGVFETTFHQTVPPAAYTYGVPFAWQETYGVRRYGFHGASHRYVTERLTALRGRADFALVNCHLGSGTSVAAIRDGRSLDISSGFTPQSGTIMSTRPGDFDPWVFPYMMVRLGVGAEEVNRILVQEGGLAGISGVSGDMRDLEAAAAAGNRRAELAIEVFCWQVKRYIGAYAAILNGLDVLAFTGGIGEKSPTIRSRICREMDFLGIILDEEANTTLQGEGKVSAPESRVEIWVITTNEELMVARETLRLLESGGGKTPAWR